MIATTTNTTTAAAAATTTTTTRTTNATTTATTAAATTTPTTSTTSPPLPYYGLHYSCIIRNSAESSNFTLLCTVVCHILLLCFHRKRTQQKTHSGELVPPPR